MKRSKPGLFCVALLLAVFVNANNCQAETEELSAITCCPRLPKVLDDPQPPPVESKGFTRKAYYDQNDWRNAGWPKLGSIHVGSATSEVTCNYYAYDALYAIYKKQPLKCEPVDPTKWSSNYCTLPKDVDFDACQVSCSTS